MADAIGGRLTHQDLGVGGVVAVFATTLRRGGRQVVEVRSMQLFIGNVVASLSLRKPRHPPITDKYYYRGGVLFFCVV